MQAGITLSMKNTSENYIEGSSLFVGRDEKMIITTIAGELARATIHVITGKFTDEQIRRIKSNVVGAYIADWISTPKAEAK